MLRVVEAQEGDCLLVRHGPPESPRALLCDGGTSKTFDPHLLAALEAMGTSILDAVILSHTDNDHVLGLLDLFAWLRDRPQGDRLPLRIEDLWINEFDGGRGRIEGRLASLLEGLAAQSRSMAAAAASLSGIREGHRLRVLAVQLNVPVNGRTGGKPFLASSAHRFSVQGLAVRVVGPTRANLDALEEQWLAWLEKQEARVAKGELDLAAMSDRSVPNLSSMQLLVEAEGKAMLLTGDSRGDHLLQALEEAGLLARDGSLEVDLLKVPHHGSDRNATRRFFERVKARTYVISANGKHGNPDLSVLQWIVESRAGDHITLVLTNRTPSVDRLEQAFPPVRHGYSLRIRPPAENFVDVELS